MLKKITIGTAIAAAVFFVLTLCTIPFAVKQQVGETSKLITIAKDIPETQIKPSGDTFSFVFKDNMPVSLYESYDENIHIDFSGILTGNIDVSVSGNEENPVAVIDKGKSDSENLLERIISDQSNAHCKIYIPKEVTAKLIGDYYLRNQDESIKVDSTNAEEVATDEYEESYNFYISSAGLSDNDTPEAAIQKLVYGASLASVDYAQGDINRPEYIDVMGVINRDIENNSWDFFNGKDELLSEGIDIDIVVQRATAYIRSQMDYAYTKEIIRLSLDDIDNEHMSYDMDAQTSLARGEEEVRASKNAFMQILMDSNMDNSKINQIVNIFQI